MLPARAISWLGVFEDVERGFGQLPVPHHERRHRRSPERSRHLPIFCRDAEADEHSGDEQSEAEGVGVPPGASVVSASVAPGYGTACRSP